MKKAVLLLLFFGIICLSRGTAQVQKTKAVEVARDSIASGFMMKVEDVLWQTGWHPVSLDRMSVMVDSYTFGRYGPQPEFILDGIPFDPTFMGITYSQLFPLPIHQLKKTSVSTKDGFGIRNGLPYESGIVALHSEPLTHGVSIFGSGQIGHNSGEPGPWAYDSENVTPNIERFGPWLDGGIGLKFGGWYAKAVIKKHSYQHFNDFLQNRIISLIALPEEGIYDRPDAETELGLAEMGYESEHVTIRVQGIESNSDEFLYFQPLAREVPTSMQWKQYSGLADIGITEKIGVQSLVQWKEKSLGYRRHRFSHDFNWQEQERLIRGSLYYQNDKTKVSFGAENLRPTVDAPDIDWPVEGVLGLFADISGDFSKRISAGASGIIKEDGDEKTTSVTAFGSVKPTLNWKIELRGGYSEIFGWQANSIESWVRNGYNIFSQMGIQQIIWPSPTDRQIFPEKSRYRFISVSNTFTFSDYASLNISAQLTDHLALHIPFQQALYDLTFSTQPGYYLLYENERGRRLDGTITFEHQIVQRLWQKFQMNINRVIEGNNSYENYWETSPKLLVQHALRFKPFSDIEIVMDTQFITKRIWTEFEQLDGRLNRTFHVQFPSRIFEFRDTLPSHINVDVSVSKWFWNQRIRGVLQLKNILDQPYQTHPIGVMEGFGYITRIELRL